MNIHTKGNPELDRDEMIESLKGLLAIPSVKGPSVDGAPFGVKTAEALEYMLNLGRSMGFSVANLDGYVGTIEYGEGDREVAMLCHLDVVPAGEGWGFDPFDPFVKDGKIFGRGACDDKGPAIACLYAMKSLRDAGYVPPCRIRLVLGLDEESGSGCMQYYKTRQDFPTCGFAPDAEFPVIYAEKGILHITLGGAFAPAFPTRDEVLSISAKGGERPNMVPAACEISWIENPEKKLLLASTDSPARKSRIVEGRPGHASMPDAAENAVSKAMAELKSMLDAAQASHPFVDFYTETVGLSTDGSLLGIACRDDDSGALTLNVGLMDLTPESVSMTIDIRYPVTASSAHIVEKIRRQCGAAGLEITDVRDTPPLFADKDSLFIQTLLGVYNKVMHANACPIAIGGGTYARSMPNVVAFGPHFTKEDDVAHQAGEFMRIEALERCREIYQKAVLALAAYATKG